MDKSNKNNYKIVTLYRGCNLHEKNCIVTREFHDITWWSTNIKDAGHYYEGCCLKMDIKLYTNSIMRYVQESNQIPSNYTFGYEEMECPKGSIWYSFGKEYLKENILEIREVQPEFYEDDKDVDDDDINNINKNNI